jgi:hypothetical protein
VTVAEDEQTAEEIARDRPAEDDLDEDDEGQMMIPGTAPTISMKVGGPKPTSAEMRIQGGAVGIEGEFQKEEVVHLLVTVRVEDVHFPSTRDKTGKVTSTKRLHLARPIAISRAETLPDD